MKSDTFEELKFALSAYDTANVHAMRLWYAASLISVSILTSVAGLGDLNFVFSENFKIVDALPAVLLILSALNFIFVVAQISHYRMAEVYKSFVDERFSDSDRLTSKYTWHELAIRAPIAGHNRIMPMLASVGMNPKGKASSFSKAVFDCVFGMFPAFGLAVGLWKLPTTSPLYALNTVIGFISIFASFLIAKHAYLWVKKNFDF